MPKMDHHDCSPATSYLLPPLVLVRRDDDVLAVGAEAPSRLPEAVGLLKLLSRMSWRSIELTDRSRGGGAAESSENRVPVAAKAAKGEEGDEEEGRGDGTAEEAEAEAVQLSAVLLAAVAAAAAMLATISNIRVRRRLWGTAAEVEDVAEVAEVETAAVVAAPSPRMQSSEPRLGWLPLWGCRSGSASAMPMRMPGSCGSRAESFPLAALPEAVIMAMWGGWGVDCLCCRHC